MDLRELTSWVAVVAATTFAIVADGDAQTNATALPRYAAVTDRIARPKPPLPGLGPAGRHFTDPTFGTRILRVTDNDTRPGYPGRSFTVASAAHQLAWNAASDIFYVRSIDGTFIPYRFLADTMTVSRIQPGPADEGGLVIRSQVEPQFSFLDPNVLYGSRQDADPARDWPIIRSFNFSTLQYTDVLNLGALSPIDPVTYAASLSSSASTPEKLSVLFGGVQDTHYKVAVFERSSPQTTAAVLDTMASTIVRAGVARATNVSLHVPLHHAWLDQSGRFITLFPVNAKPVPLYVWDLTTDVITPITVRANGHDATGFGLQINQDCCAATVYDAAQWQVRALSNPQVSVDLVVDPLRPPEVTLGDHTSWNNAQSTRLVPVLSALYRYFDGSSASVPWRAWDDEVVAIDTARSGLTTTVWRFAHHRSDIAYDGDAGRAFNFWYLPIAIVSPNGRWAIFTSNWEKTLGTAQATDFQPGGWFRSDVFLISLTKTGTSSQFTDDPIVTGGTPIKAVHITELRSRIDVLRLGFGLTAFPWTDPGVPAGTVAKRVHLTEMRGALRDAYAAAGLPPPVYSDQAITASVTPMRVAHIQQLRDAIVDLELN